MKISDKYKIISTDDKNVTIQEKVVTEKEDGSVKTSWKVIGYYGSINSALKGIVRKEINGTGLKNFNTVCEKIEELNEYIDEVCK
ncbi:hypothetical protein [Terrisporobacter petrolearius]|uniref:hypothetical protein n=1 Tax=Terrisporobacter petrolearius TaxID=1460447 RepID=UPI003AFFCAEC